MIEPTSVKTCQNPHIIECVMRSDYWRAVWINGICYFRTFEDNVIYHQGIHIEQRIEDEKFDKSISR